MLSGAAVACADGCDCEADDAVTAGAGAGADDVDAIVLCLLSNKDVGSISIFIMHHL